MSQRSGTQSGPNNDDWFDALGKPVPYGHRARAADQAREMGLDLDGRGEVEFIGPIARAIENDRPNRALEHACKRLDLTGAYRLLAYLCTDPADNTGVY